MEPKDEPHSGQAPAEAGSFPGCSSSPLNPNGGFWLPPASPFPGSHGSLLELLENLFAAAAEKPAKLESEKIIIKTVFCVEKRQPRLLGGVVEGIRDGERRLWRLKPTWQPPRLLRFGK